MFLAASIPRVAMCCMVDPPTIENASCFHPTMVPHTRLGVQRGGSIPLLCSAYTLAEKLTIFSPFPSPSPAKTRTSSRSSRAHGHHLRPATNCDKLSAIFLLEYCTFVHYIFRQPCVATCDVTTRLPEERAWLTCCNAMRAMVPHACGPACFRCTRARRRSVACVLRRTEAATPFSREGLSGVPLPAT